MRKGWTICLLTLFCTAAAGGCNQMGVKQDPASAYNQVHEQFTNQQSYEFYGRTKLLTDNSANANMVNFSGRKNGDAMYMNVKLSVPEENRVDTLSLLHQEDQLYAKTGNEANWKSVAGADKAYRQEMNNWSPAFSFEQMDQMKSRALPMVDENPNDDVEAMRVVLDSTRLKKWLASQMKEQTAAGSTIQMASRVDHRPKLKLAMSLSNGDWNQSRSRPSIQSKANPDIDEIVNQMDLEAEYTIYYRKSTMLPTSMYMSIRSEYDLKDQRVQEHSQVETYLRNYGNAGPLPDLSGNAP